MRLDYFIVSPTSASATERAQIALRGNESYEAGARRRNQKARIGFERRKTMLWTIFVILLVLWLLGLATSYTMGGLIHVLLVIAVIVLIINLLQGRKVV
jgi:Family of unknown function (DUF5670)